MKAPLWKQQPFFSIEFYFHNLDRIWFWVCSLFFGVELDRKIKIIIIMSFTSSIRHSIEHRKYLWVNDLEYFLVYWLSHTHIHCGAYHVSCIHTMLNRNWPNSLVISYVIIRRHFIKLACSLNLEFIFFFLSLSRGIDVQMAIKVNLLLLHERVSKSRRYKMIADKLRKKRPNVC